MEKQNKKYVDDNPYSWGDETGTCLASYDQMLFHPRQAFDAIRAYCEFHDIHDVSRTKIQTDTMSLEIYKKLIKDSQKWLKSNHRIWSTIVSHLDATSMHVTGGLELSNGIALLSTLKTKYGHTHAQCQR